MLSRLKSLELQGYKTFASRTLFEFPGDITAIVGPNGSGKSNIADALRWVLGEQSYSLLRGRKTEDMIFSGSEQRQRASMASAAITFDNEDNWLPIDYSEVLLARRAYRDGQNEYVLNGQRVRLKEISELLSQSGLAERTYTIIGQGLVDAALSLKPEERRKFFEEAAGIGLYRSRREEAINRLDVTRRNLERVLDILSELEPRLKSLERQAARAIEHDRIKDELKNLLREWYGYHWHKIQGNVTHSREVLQAQEKKLDQAKQKYEEVDTRVRELREKVSQVRSRLNEWHSRSAELHSQREKVNRALAVLDERRRALTDQQTTLQLDLSRLQEEENLHRDRLKAMEVERARLQSELKEAEIQAGKARLALTERENSRSRLEKDVRDLRRQLIASETRQVQLKAHLDEVKARLNTLRKNLENTQAAIQPAELVVAAAKKKLDGIEEKQKQIDARRQLMDRELKQLQESAAQAETDRKRTQDEIAEISAQKTKITTQLDIFEQAEHTLTGLNHGSKTLLQAAHQGKLTGKYQSLSQLIEVPIEYEQAVTAALGDALEGIALEESTDPEQALELLSQGDSGRATLYPLNWLKKEATIKAPRGSDCIGVASDLVQARNGGQSVIDLLLGQVLIARDRKSARNIASRQPSHVRVVTLEGEIFSGSGAVTAGKVSRSALLARPRLLREARESLAEIEIRQSQVAAKAKKAAENVEKTRELLQVMEKEIRDLEQLQRQTAREMQQAVLEFEQARQKHDWQKSQIQNFTEQIEKSENERDESQSALRKIEGGAESFDLQIAEIQRSLDKLPIADFQTQVVHWDTQKALAVHSLKEADRRLMDFQLQLQTNLEQQKTYQTRSEMVNNAQVLHDKEKTEQTGLETQLNEAISDLHVKIEPDELELTQLEERYDRLQGDLSSAQQAVSVAERYATQAQLEAGRLRDGLDSLRHRIEEDFGLVAFEYSAEISGPTPLPLDGMVQQLPMVVQIPPDLEDSINRQRGQLRRMGAINPEAQSEYISVKDRYTFLTGQVADLKKADADLHQVISELDDLMKTEFRKTFKAVAAEFSILFTRLFGGGSARLVLQDEDNPTEGGIDIEARLPGRREQGLSLLSGGERSLTAVALIFSLLKVSPTPFCVMDEVDAMLDEANVGRFCDLLRELSQTTQFIVITHNRNTVQVADVIYGVTMGKDSASQVISLRLDEVPEEMVR